MKIVLLNTFESKGGAAIACKRLMRALQKQGVDVKLVVRDKTSGDTNVISVNSSFFKRNLNFARFAWERFIIYCNNKFNKENLFTVSLANTGIDVSKLQVVNGADIIHIHWTNQGFLSLSDIKKLIDTGKPIVLTMHDMWSFTGICHYSAECDNYSNACENCFLLGSKKTTDLSTKIFRRKQIEIYSKPVNLIGCSKWISDKAKLSRLTQNSRVLSIPNPIDTDVFRKNDKIQARENLNLPLGKKLILFGALNIGDKRKGADYLIKAIKNLREQYQADYENVNIVVFGQAKGGLDEYFGLTIHYMGYLNGNEQIVDLYNAVDIYATPSMEDNLPNMIMESMACGTPCIGFNTGGIPEMIDHELNGYVAEYKSVDDLARGIHRLIFAADYDKLSENARQKVVDFYSEEIIAKKYIDLYNDLLNNEGV